MAFELKQLWKNSDFERFVYEQIANEINALTQNKRRNIEVRIRSLVETALVTRLARLHALPANGRPMVRRLSPARIQARSSSLLLRERGDRSLPLPSLSQPRQSA